MTALPNIELSYGTRMRKRARVRRRQFGEGRSQRDNVGRNPVRQRWQLVWEGITEAEANQLDDFFTARAGVEVITWTPHGQSTELKWTTDGDWTVETTAHNQWTVKVNIQQEYDA